MVVWFGLAELGMRLVGNMVFSIYGTWGIGIKRWMEK